MSMLFYFTILKHHFINIPYHFTIPLHPKTLFLLKYYFLTHFLLFLLNRSAYFPGLFNGHFYSSLPAPIQHTTHTHYTTINLSKPIITPTHTQTQTSNQQQSHAQTQPSNKATHKHNPATKPSHTHKHKPIQKLGHRSKTQARPLIHATDQPIHTADLKPRPPIKNQSKPIQKKSSPEQTHSKNIIIGAMEQTHSIKSSSEPSEQIHSKK